MNPGVEVELQQIPAEVLVLEMNTVIRAYSYIERNHHEKKLKDQSKNNSSESRKFQEFKIRIKKKLATMSRTVVSEKDEECFRQKGMAA